MLQAHARVIECHPGYALVESLRQTACGTCSSKGHCGTALLGEALVSRERLHRVWVRDPIGVHPGDQVIVGIPEDGMLGASLLLYGLPLMGMVIGLLGGQAFGDGAALVAGVTLFIIGLLLTAPLGRIVLGQKTEPVILGRSIPAGFDCALSYLD